MSDSSNPSRAGHLSPTTAALTIRVACLDDLPYIHGLIRESYGAMIPFYPTVADVWTLAAEECFTTEGDLHPSTFLNNYHHCSFWVCQRDVGNSVDADFHTDSDASLSSSIVGCVGLKRHSDDDGELVRMSVSAKMRGAGVGQLLVQQLEMFCLEHDILRIVAQTANPGAARFYEKKCGFTVAETYTQSMQGEVLQVSKLVKYLGERVIRKVAIVGGTHGNERIGVQLVNQWATQISKAKSISDCEVWRGSFETKVLIGNPRAVQLRRRFVDADLNRQCNTSIHGANKHDDDTMESKRLIYLQALLGHKRKESDSACAYTEGGIYGTADFIIDLHSTDSTVGMMCMISAGDWDPPAVRLAAHLLTIFPTLKVTFSAGNKWDSPSIDSIGRHGVTFVVGPCAHGIVDSFLLEQTRALVRVTLDYFDCQNRKATFNYIDDHDGVLSVTEVGDCENMTIARGPRIQYLSLNSQLTKSPQIIDVYMMVSYVRFPSGHMCVHPRLVGRDFQTIKPGDVAFISTDGHKTEHRFDYPKSKDDKEVSIAEQKELFLVFINEPASVARNIAFAVYAKHQKTVF